MPANKYALLRYRIIDRCLTNSASPFPNKEKLREACEEALYGSLGENISESTIEKDLWAMRNENELGYFAPIAYNRIHKGYYYEDPNYSINNLNLNDEDINALTLAASTLYQFRNTPIFSQYEHTIEKIVARLSIGSNANDRSPDPYIQFEEAPKILGIEFLGPILRCIQHHQEMAFAYKKYTDDAGDESKTVQPYLLKEYRNRWYLIAFDKDKLDYRTYGLDRMIQVNPLDLFFTPDPSFNPDTFFRHSIGITQIDTTPSNIEFECSPLLAKYLESQPIHQSQKIQFSEMGTHRVQLHVLITYELISILRSYGSDVKIIAPDSLRTRVINDLKITLKNYSTT